MSEAEMRNEDARLAALHALNVLDTPPEESFDRIVRLARTMLQVPIGFVSLIDRNRQWFKSLSGLETSEIPRRLSFCSRTIEQDEPLVLPDAALDPRFADSPFVTDEPHVRFYVGVQLKHRDGFNLGTLCCIDTKPREISPEQIAILQDLAQLVIDELELRQIASTDSLTGAMTRRAFFEAAHRDFALAERYGRPFSCVIMDADHFKRINDTYGHAVGDRVLRRFVAICRTQLRASDYIGRLGGEEFVIVLHEADGAAAARVARRLGDEIGREVFETSRGPVRMTVSGGVAARDGSTRHFDDLLNRADQALYRAKTSGRNRVELFEPDERVLRRAS